MTSEGKTRCKTSGLVEGTEIVPNNLRIRVTDMGKLRWGNAKDDFGTCEFLFVEKGFDRLEVRTPRWLGDRAINNAQKFLSNKDCLHKEGPFMVVSFVE
jgi:hypothetical protein